MTRPSDTPTANSAWDQLREVLQSAVSAQNVVAVIFRKPDGGLTHEQTNDADPLESATSARIRPLLNGDSLVFQCTRQVGRQALHKNIAAAEFPSVVESMLRSEFRAATLQTTAADYILKRKGTDRLKIQQRKPTATQVTLENHDRERRYLIAEGQPCPFLQELGVMNAEGHVRKAKYHKFRQMNRFAELVDDIVDELPADRAIRILDFGCGRSYLTFALHYLLTAIRQRSTDILGIDCRPDVIQSCAAIVDKLQLQGLRFRCADIATATTNQADFDLAVSLHACDTATDDALQIAVQRRAQVILSVPCCQHELAAKIQNDELAPVLEHGLFRERLNQLATDSLRARALAACGYQTQIVEFIDLEHTGRNVLLRAVRRPDPERQQKARVEYAQLKSFLHLGEIHLDRIFCEVG